jgi:hypothetical protein
VTKAVNEPRKFVLAAMNFLQTRGLRGFAVPLTVDSYRV